MDLNTYAHAGMALELLQKWEKDFKEVTIVYNIEKSDDKRSLSNMNSFLFRNKIINEDEYKLIKGIIEKRNLVIHRMFVDYLNNNQMLIALTIDLSKDIEKSKELFVKLLENAKKV